MDFKTILAIIGSIGGFMIWWYKRKSAKARAKIDAIELETKEREKYIEDQSEFYLVSIKQWIKKESQRSGIDYVYLTDDIFPDIERKVFYRCLDKLNEIHRDANGRYYFSRFENIKLKDN